MGALLPAAATAQEAPSDSFRRDRNTSVRERPKPEYAPLGVTAGGFRLFPEAAIGLDYSDNAFAVETGEEADSALMLDTALRLASNWNSDELHASLSSSSRYASEFDNLDRTNWAFGVGGRKDVVRSLFLYADLIHQQTHEELWSSGASAALAEPIPYSVSEGVFGAQKTFNRIRVRGEGRHGVYDYDDTPLVGGGLSEQDDRDRSQTELGGRVDFATGPSTAIFASATLNWREYDLAASGRDSNGAEFLLGAAFDVTRLIRGEIGVGHLSQNYDAPGVADTSDFAVRSSLEWFPDELVTVGLSFSRSVVDADVASATSYVSDEVAVSVDYELRRNIVVGANLSFSADDYQGVAREYERTRFGLTGDYLVNRSAILFAQLAYYSQSSNEPTGREYKINRATLGLRLRR